MRKLSLLTLCCIISFWAMATDITPDVALQQATQFLQSKTVHGGQGQKAPRVVPQLSLAGTVNNLYVFNTKAGQGFVIVSNDDIATPILGYSDSGSLDLQHIPANMQAWLQGYADEIAWAKQHNVVSNPMKAQLRRAAAATKTPIAPLVQTHWNQNSPYNNLCPEYATDTKCATGCVATAMAQCMYYAEMRAGSTTTVTTAEIPTYTTDDYEFVMPAISAGTEIYWQNMIEDYSGSYTTAQGSAIAQLMYYCGLSVKMEYGPESGSNTDKVATALVNYFDYKSTTQFVNRNDYSYENWIELMYHELSLNRPVCFGGSKTSGGGHEFVLDGYQGEDFFHINWGWGGLSDNYFKLSALDPDAEGIGGINAAGGYCYGQDAVIGIQKNSEDLGDVLDVATLNYGLTLESITLSKNSVVTGESVDITMRITNNSEDAYDADLMIVDLNSYSVVGGKPYYIPAGETKDCVFTFTPTAAGTYTLTVANGRYYFINYATKATLTVTNSGVETTDNITLGRSLSVENSELTSGKSYKVYGSIFKGTLTITNPSTTLNYSGTYQYDLYKDYDWANPVVRKAQKITVPANSSIEIPVEYKGMNNGSIYELDVVYRKNDNWTGFDEVGYYTAQPGVTTTDAAGNIIVVKPSTSYTVPAAATSVDLTGCGVMTVTKNGNPNCLYILGASDAVPAGLTNVVTSNGSGNYSAESITLTDGQNFYSPVDFTATNIEFTYNNSRQADGSAGWNTIVLPFDVSKVTANGTQIDWFHSSSDKNKQFWVKEFTGDGANTVNFGYASQIKANTPYIIALPGNHWGTEYDLSGKTIKFVGENAEVSASDAQASITGSNYRFIGSTSAVSIENIYCLNAAGSSFALKTSGGSTAFRAFFKPGIFDRTVTMLSIGSDSGTTGINATLNDKGQTRNGNVVLDLQGRRVAQPSRGLYIVNGKKVVVK